MAYLREASVSPSVTEQPPASSLTRREPRRQRRTERFPAAGRGPLAARRAGGVRRPCDQPGREGWRAGLSADDCLCNGKVAVDAGEVGRQDAVRGPVVLTVAAGPRQQPTETELGAARVSTGGAALPRLGAIPPPVCAAAAVPGHRAVT